MASWVLNDKLRSVWIAVFFLAIVIFNLLNVRKYGEIEYWLTVAKIEGIVVLIALGIILPMGASSETRLLGTGVNNTIVACNITLAAQNQCLESPGFACNTFDK